MTVKITQPLNLTDAELFIVRTALEAAALAAKDEAAALIRNAKDYEAMEDAYSARLGHDAAAEATLRARAYEGLAKRAGKAQGPLVTLPAGFRNFLPND